MKMISDRAGSALFKEMVPLSERNVRRKEYEELALRYFAYANNYQEFQKSVDQFLTDYLRDRNENATDADLDAMSEEFDRTLLFVQQHFPNGFKRQGYKTVPRIRFEAIAVGVTLALRERPELQPVDILTWLDSPQFIVHTRSDASNSRPKLINRIHYVRDHLLGTDIEEDPDTALVESSANEDAPPDNEPDQPGLFE